MSTHLEGEDLETDCTKLVTKPHIRYAMRDKVWINEAQTFADKLSTRADSIDFSKIYTAGYDSPMKFWNRRNEVMFLVNTNEV